MIEFESSYGVSDLGGDHIEHSGIKLMKWGVRRYQYEDGSLTPLGREHYGVGPARGTKKKEAPAGSSGKSQSVKEKLKSKLKQFEADSKARATEKAAKKEEQRKETEAKRKADAERAEKEKAEAERKQKEEAERKDKEEREKIINSGSSEEVLKNLDRLSSEELARAFTRIEARRKLTAMVDENKPKPVAPVETPKPKAPEEYKGEHSKSNVYTDEEKKSILGSGDPKLIRKNLDMFSTTELAEALARADYNSKLRDLAVSKIGSFDRLAKTAQNVSTIVKAVGDVKKAISGDKSNQKKTNDTNNTFSNPNKSEKKTKAASEPESKSKPETKSKSESKPEPETKPATESKHKTETKPATESKPKTETKPKDEALEPDFDWTKGYKPSRIEEETRSKTSTAESSRYEDKKKKKKGFFKR